MNWNWFAHIVVHHPYIILSAVTVFSGTCLIIPFTLKSNSFPDFSDPQAGFSTRGTTISKRLVAWENLVKSTKPSGQFAINPKDILMRNTTFAKPKIKKVEKKVRNKQRPKNNISKVYVNEDKNRSDNSYEKWKVLSNMLRPKMNEPVTEKPVETDGFLCGYPDERYAHVVLKSHNNENLFTLRSLLALCRIEHEFTETNFFSELCTTNPKQSSKCCRPWSLVNYIAILHNKTSCLSITEEDVNSTISLLTNCSHYFHNLHLMPNCVEKGHCDAPSECIKHDLVFNVLNFLTSTTFLPPNSTGGDDLILSETIIFLPVACSTATLPYYHYLEGINLDYEGISVVAMEFGIKSALFDEYLIKESWLIVFGIIFVLFCIWFYTKSLFLTIMTIISIVFSLGISYFMYTLVFELNFFPFINLLALIVAIGIGADDVFVFCKIWYTVKQEKNSSVLKVMNDTFRHALFSIFVTSLTTSVAFFASYASSVTAIRCFSIFAGTSVIINFLLMVTWFPASIIIWERSCCSNVDLAKSCLMACLQRWCCSNIIKPQWNLSATWPTCPYLERFWSSKERFLLNNIINFRYIWVVTLSVVALISAVIVVYYPKLQLPTTKEFQLFHSKHPFEQYDFTYKNHFWFRRAEKSVEMNNYKLPLRFVWGVLPSDNGNYLDPTNFGKLELDPTFDVAKPESQKWLLEFCYDLKRQPFFQAIFGPLLPNCFIETFKRSMQRDCINSFSYRDHSPCCKTSKFPFNSTVFTKCIVEEMTEIYETPGQYSIPGIAGPKFSKDQFPTIKAVIVEYDSNYSYSMSYEYMDEFYSKVEGWMEERLKTAPDGMKNGWFVSDLQFYDLQKELSKSTIIAISISMGLAIIVLFLSTLNILTSLYAILTVTCSIFVTIAVLILLGWQLNILESITISTAIGLTVDYSLHYAVNYGLCPINMTYDRINATRYALSNMAGPVMMAALTTGIAGAFMLPSSILPYIQIGIFLITVMVTSWFYATFFLGSLLAALGPENRFWQFSYTNLICLNPSRSKISLNQKDHQIKSCSSSDTHELDSLTKYSCSKISTEPLSNSSKSFKDGSLKGVGATSRDAALNLCTNNRDDKIEVSEGVYISSKNINSINVKYVFTDQSPSATSAITIITADDN